MAINRIKMSNAVTVSIMNSFCREFFYTFNTNSLSVQNKFITEHIVKVSFATMQF